MSRNPRLYDADKIGAEQSAVPSQDFAPGIPYYPSELSDIFQMTPDAMVAAAEQALADGGLHAGDITSFTRYVYDSRPPMAVDFAGPYCDLFTTAVALFDGSTTIPQGYVGIVREVNFTTSAEFFRMDQFGGFTTSAFITLFRNGSPIFGMSNINVGQWGMATVTLPCFIMLNAGDTISGKWNDGQVVYAYGNGFEFYGQLLIDDGRDLQLQSGNYWPEPVTEVNPSSIGTNSPPRGAAPVAGLPGPTTPSVNYVTFYAAPYAGPFAETNVLSVDTYLRLRDDWHRQVRMAYLQFVKDNPGKIIEVTGSSGDALAPYNGV